MWRFSSVALLGLMPPAAIAGNLRQATTAFRSSNELIQDATSAAPPTIHARRSLQGSYGRNSEAASSDDYDNSHLEEYLGCFKDDEGDPLLEFAFMSGYCIVDRCYKHCTNEGATFMAVKYDLECSCGFGKEEDYTVNGMGKCGSCLWSDGERNCDRVNSFDLFPLGEEMTPTPSSTGLPMPTGFPIPTYAPSPIATWGPTWSPSSSPTFSFTSSTMTDDDEGSSMPAPPTPAPSSPVAPTPAPVTEKPVAPPTQPPVVAPTPAPVTEKPVAPPTRPPVVAPTPAPVTEKPVAPPTPPTSGSGAPADMAELLDLHNIARCKHNADPLTWSNRVESSAREHAERLQARCGELEHSTSEQRYGFGENLYMCWGTDSCYSHTAAMQGLYEQEITDGQGNDLGDVNAYGGHATQILWKSSEELGCVEAKCSVGSTPYTILVCQYNPPGNYIGMYDQEVERRSAGNTC